MLKRSSLILWILWAAVSVGMGQASKENYLQPVKDELVKQWPHNRTINLVFHGHSVPSGYFSTPTVETLKAYPQQLLKSLKQRYPTAVINAITTSIGGENSLQGAKRFKREVLTHHPDVVFIDYALNDRAIGLEKSNKSVEKMIRQALKRKIKIILITPSPDTSVDIQQKDNELELFAAMLKDLADKYRIGWADCYTEFKVLTAEGNNLEDYMSQVNHPNDKGHRVMANVIMDYFK